MRTSQISLLVCTILVNVGLMYSYYLQGLRAEDFGNFPTNLKVYVLVSASIAYVCNLAQIYNLSRQGNDDTLLLTTVCVIAFYTLQLGFIPLLRRSLRDGNRWPVRILLLVAVLPVSILAGIGIESDRVSALLGVITAMHVFLNDALLFGFLY